MRETAISQQFLTPWPFLSRTRTENCTLTIGAIFFLHTKFVWARNRPCIEVIVLQFVNGNSDDDLLVITRGFDPEEGEENDGEEEDNDNSIGDD